MKKLLILLAFMSSPVLYSSQPPQYHPLAQALKLTFDSADFRSNFKNVLVNQIKQLALTPEQKSQAQRLLILAKEGLSFNVAALDKAQKDYWKQRAKVFEQFNTQQNEIYNKISSLEELLQPPQKKPLTLIMPQKLAPPQTKQSPEEIQKQIDVLKQQLHTLQVQQQQAEDAITKPAILQQSEVWSEKLSKEISPFADAFSVVFGTPVETAQYFMNFGKEIVDALLQALQEK